MSAGGLSYDCLTTSRKVTLPSVEMWGTNMNILRDPPASKYTRRIDKVGDTQQVLLAQEASGDRIAEMINVYARGVNPMVSVSYDNYGNNAGARNSILQGNRAVKLPYKPEVFHPPVFRQEDLMPLSRQPRTWFYALSNPEIPGIVQQMSCPETKCSIWPDDKRLQTEAKPTLQYNTEMPLTTSEMAHRPSVLREKLLDGDRKALSQPMPEASEKIHPSLCRSNTVHPTVLRPEAVTQKIMDSVGSHTDATQYLDPKTIQHNKSFYHVFANRSSKQGAPDHREYIKKIQSRAIQENKPMTFHHFQNPSAVLEIPQAPLSASAHARHLKDAPAVEVKPNLSVPYPQSSGMQSRSRPKESTNEYLYTSTVTKPSQTSFWKQVEPIYIQHASTHETVLHPETTSNLSMPHAPATLQDNAEPSRGLHPHLRTRSVVSSQQYPIETMTVPTALSKEPQRVLPPMILSETNKQGLYTRSHNVPEQMEGGQIETHPIHVSAEAPRSQPQASLSTEQFHNVPLPIRWEPLQTECFTQPVRDVSSLQQSLYQDTVQPSARHNRPRTEAYATKTSFENNDWMRNSEKHILPSRLGNLSTDTARNVEAMGYHLYDTQSTDASKSVSTLPTTFGSFDPRPQGIPQAQRSVPPVGDMPINHRMSSLQSRVNREYSQRFSDPYH